MNIDVRLFDKLQISSNYNTIGKIDENKATILTFHFLDNSLNLEDKHFYLDIEMVSGNKYKTSELEIKDNIAQFEVTNNLLEEKGKILLEPILYGEDKYVLKYPTLEFQVVDTLNAIDEILEEKPDFVSEFKQIKDIIKTDGEGNKFLSDSGKYIKIDEISLAKASNVLFEDGQNFQEKFDNGDLKGEKGEKGDSGEKGDIGPQGEQGIQGIPGKDGSNGLDGKSAYDIWLELGNTGSKEEFINSLKGLDGVNGKDGLNGIDGKNGKDAVVDYEQISQYINEKVGNINNILSTLTTVNEVQNGNN